jgi:hypothetical protein
MLEHDFEIERVGTFHPIGDQGLLRIVNSRWLARPLQLVGLGETWQRAREFARLGCEFTIEARRR